MKIGSATVMMIVGAALCSTACNQLSSEKTEPPEQANSSTQPLGSASASAGTRGKTSPGPEKAGPAAEEQPFQGEIKLVFEYPKEHSTRAFTYRIKGDHVLYEQEAPVGKGARDSALYDSKTDITYAVDAAHKRYAELKPEPGPAGGASQEVTVTKTDKRTEILGMPCYLWRLGANDGDQQAEAWVTTGVPYFVLNESGKPGTRPWWATPLSQNRAFPLRLIVRDKLGQVLVEADAKAVDAKKLEDSMFTVPRDFNLIDSTAGLRLPGVS